MQTSECSTGMGSSHAGSQDQHAVKREANAQKAQEGKKIRKKKIHPLSETLEIFQPNSHVPSSKETEGFTEGEGVNNNDQRLGLQNGI